MKECCLRDLSVSALKIVADPCFGGSAVQSPSPCTEIELARLATQKPEEPIFLARLFLWLIVDRFIDGNDSAFDGIGEQLNLVFHSEFLHHRAPVYLDGTRADE